MTANMKRLIAGILAVSILVFGLAYVKYRFGIKNQKDTSSYLYYGKLVEDTSKEDPLQYIDEDFYMKEGFSSNLPLVVLETDGELPNYKTFDENEEIVYEDVDPWITGKIQLYDKEGSRNSINDKLVMSS